MASDKLKIRFQEIERLALAAGLKPFEVHFFEVPSPVIWQTAAYGLPTRYSHWSFGKGYQHQETQGEMGFAKIYELVINNNPSIAYLDKNNTDTVNLLIAAHVYAHSDFFANNIMFKKANETQMVDVAAQHAAIIDQFRTDYGDDAVDEWLDVALSLEQHVDIYKGRRRQRYPKRAISFEERKQLPWEDVVGNEEPLIKKVVKGIHIPPAPEKDILWFLSEYANLESWQKKIFEIVRRESYYFYPQFRTKFMNEGWACVSADTRIKTNKGFIRASDYVKTEHNDTLVYNGKEFTKRSDVHITEPKPGFKIITNRGLIFIAAENHKIKHYERGYVFCKELKIGDKICLAPAVNTWPTEYQWVSSTYKPSKYANRDAVQLPEMFQIDCDFARFVAFWIGEGCQSKDRTIIIRNSNFDVLKFYGEYIQQKFAINFTISEVNDGGPNRWDLYIHSRAFHVLLDDITGNIKALARDKDIPDVIFKSPEDVVVSFIRGLFDAEGCAYIKDKSRALIFASASLKLISSLATLLHGFDIKCSIGKSKKHGYEDGYQLVICNKQNILRFINKIGCNDVNKLAKFEEIVKSIDLTKYTQKERDYAIVKDITPVFESFYDFTVPDGHEYSANGLMHHNSYWHAELMSQYALGQENDYGVKDIEFPLTSEEHFDFASYHEKVVQPGIKVPLKIKDVDPSTGQAQKRWNPKILENPRLFGAATRLNPYYVGFRIFRDIKERWDEYYKQGYMENEWKEKVEVTIDGATKIRQVMEEEDDVSFMRNYLTEKLAAELHMFAYGSTEDYDDSYDIQEGSKKREKGDLNPKLPLDAQIVKNQTVAVRTKKVRDIVNTMAKSRNNYGVPCIVIRRIDDSGLMRLEHIPDDSVNIDINYAEHVLRYIYFAWRRPVEMIRKAKDKTWLLTYDGIQFEVNHETPDYPECIEDTDVPSSW